MSALYRLRFAILGIVGAALIVASVVTLRDGGDDVAGVRGHLGPTPGPATAEDYLSEKRTYLRGIAESEPTVKAAALVSFKSYLPAPGVQRIVGRLKTTAAWVRLPSAEAEPVLVETTIAGAVADRAAALRKALDAEIAELEAQAARAQPAAKADLQTVIAEMKADLAKANGDCGCVFALAVEDAEIGDLAKLLDHPTVRIVDVPDPLTDDLKGWELQPFVPRSR